MASLSIVIPLFCAINTGRLFFIAPDDFRKKIKS